MDIQSFIGLGGYDMRFVYGFASISSPLATFTEKKSTFEWSEACEKGFQELKYNLTSTYVLTLLEGTQWFVGYFDASQVWLGSVLMQLGKVIAYDSSQLKVHHQNYPSHDLQLPIVVFSLKISKHYLYGVHVDMFMDHKHLKNGFTQMELNLQQSRWLELLKEYDMSIIYHPARLTWLRMLYSFDHG